jgi:hypothetical protein
VSAVDVAAIHEIPSIFQLAGRFAGHQQSVPRSVDQLRHRRPLGSVAGEHIDGSARVSSHIVARCAHNERVTRERDRGAESIPGTSITEGIGQGRVTANLEGVIVDEAFLVEDKDWLPVLFNLVQEEGLSLGGSSALNVLGAMRLARKLGPGKTVVTVLADYGNRYMSKLFNPEFLRSKDLPTPPWLEPR